MVHPHNLRESMDAMIGTITIFAGNFAPRGWAFCDGALLPIADHPALFSILGTSYGGDGIGTFALPDMRGRVAAQSSLQPMLFMTFIIAIAGVFPSRA